MEPITYRKMLAADIPQVARLRIRQLRDEGAAETLDLTPSLAAFYQAGLADGTYISWLAHCGETIVATSGLTLTKKPPYYGNPTGTIGLLSSMYTAPSFRRRGIARALLSRMTDEAKARGCGVIQVTASDMGMLLYADCGFRQNPNFMQLVL